MLESKDTWKKRGMFLKELGCEITDPETGKKLGDLCSDMQGGIIIGDAVNGETWHLKNRQIWEAYQNFRLSLTDEDVKEPEDATQANQQVSTDSSTSDNKAG